MAAKRVFVSFAIEDMNTKILFTGQAKNARVPYEFVDMSVKEPWSSSWKTNCKIRIKGCDGVIVLITKHLLNADGALWEIQCAIDEKKPIMGVYMPDANPMHAPSTLNGIKKVNWTWPDIASFIDSL